MKFGGRYFKHATPHMVKHIVDAINADIAFAGGMTALSGYPTAGILVFALTAVLKSVSALCADDECGRDCTCSCGDHGGG